MRFNSRTGEIEVNTNEVAAIAGANIASGLPGLLAEIERADERQKEAAEAVAEIYQDAKDRGFHDGALKAVVRLRKMRPAARAEWLRHFDAYRDEAGLDDQVEMGI